MSKLKTSIQEVFTARRQFIREAVGLSHEQAHFKSSPEVWSICENVEHIVWAERAGVYKMWIAVDNFKKQKAGWEGEAVHNELSIEEVIAKTWRPKEIVPDIAKPRWGGSIDFWIHSLAACQSVLETFAKELEYLDPAQIIYPHPISGPLNIWQRIAFLRFHLERHQAQIQRVKADPQYPT